MLIEITEYKLKTSAPPKTVTHWFNPDFIIDVIPLDIDAMKKNGWNLEGVDKLYELFGNEYGSFYIDHDSFLRARK